MINQCAWAIRTCTPCGESHISMGTYPHANEDNCFQPADIFSAFAQPSPALAHHLRVASSADEAITDEAIPEKKKVRKKTNIF
jgi:hypothetical protein